jgi:tRNA G18 (ribose-2'-O)-methylase SpoU
MAATLRVLYSGAPAGEGWCQALVRLRSAGFQIVALTPDESAQDLDGFVRGTQHQRIALLLGSEGAGLSSAAEEIADVRVRIGIRPDVDSLNVAVAAGIALHRFLAPAR